MRAGSGSDIGHVRSDNQDAFLQDEEQRLFVVADGLGGHPAGGAASDDAVEALREALSDGALDEAEDRMRVLADALVAAHDRVASAAARDPGKRGMGTTAVVIHIDDTASVLTCANIGDSRAYLLRDGRLAQITEDHSTAGPGGPTLTQALGFSREVAPDAVQLDVRAGDKLLLCTDGLTDMLADRDIRAILVKDAPPQLLCDELIEVALERGGVDNVTCIVVEV